MPASYPNKKVIIAVKYWLPEAAWMGLIFFVSSVPQGKVVSIFSFQDIVFHIFAYLILALFFSRALKNTNPDITVAQAVIFTIAFGIVYGLSDEFHQSFVPGRSVSGFDVFLDGIGSIAGSIIYR